MRTDAGNGLRSEISTQSLEPLEHRSFEAIKSCLSGDISIILNYRGEECCGFSVSKALETFDRSGGDIKKLQDEFVASVRPNNLLEKYRNAIRSSAAWTGTKPRHAEYINEHKRATITGVDTQAIRFICTPDKNDPAALRMLTAFRADVGKNSFEKECEMLDLFRAKKWGQKICGDHNARLHTARNWGL